MKISEILDQINDYLQHYTNGSADNSMKIRAINRAIDYYQLRLGLPTDKRTQEILFDSSDYFYRAKNDFREILSVRYKDENYNTEQNKFYYFDSLYDIIPTLGEPQTKRRYGVTIIDGVKYIIIHAPNLRAGKTVFENCDSLSNFNLLDDGIDLNLDLVEKQEGNASIIFNIQAGNSPASRASLLKSNVSFNWKSYIKDSLIKADIYLPNTNFDSLDFNFGTDFSNYNKITATTQEDNLPFQVGWNKIVWDLNNIIKIGIPDNSNITWFRIDFNESTGFTNAVNVRIDNLRLATPDKLIVTYLSNYKGKGGSGNDVYNFASESDEFPAGDLVPQIVNLIALRATYLLSPQLKKDTEFMTVFKAEEIDFQKQYGKLYPQERTQHFGRVKFSRL